MKSIKSKNINSTREFLQFTQIINSHKIHKAIDFNTKQESFVATSQMHSNNSTNPLDETFWEKTLALLHLLKTCESEKLSIDAPTD